jgi:hypothetical protein
MVGVVALACAIAAPGFSAATASAAVQGDVSYSLADDQVTITGCDGACPASLTIPSSIEGSPVTKIGSHAFYFQTTLNSITLPDSITSIGDNAFAAAEGLTSIVIPSGVTAIEMAAFQDTHALSSITLPAGLTSISHFAFDRTGLTSIRIPSTVRTFGIFAFHSAPNLKGIIFEGL